MIPTANSKMPRPIAVKVSHISGAMVSGKKLRWATQTQKVKNKAPQTIGPVRGLTRRGPLGLCCTGSLVASAVGNASSGCCCQPSSPVLFILSSILNSPNYQSGLFHRDATGCKPDVNVQRGAICVLVDQYAAPVK